MASRRSRIHYSVSMIQWLAVIVAIIADKTTALSQQHSELGNVTVAKLASFESASDYNHRTGDPTNYATSSPDATLETEEFDDENISFLTKSYDFKTDYENANKMNDSSLSGTSGTNDSITIVPTNYSSTGFIRGGESFACTCYDFVIEAVMMGVLCLFGFAGNIVSMICLWHDRSKSATPFLLVSLGLADTLFLVTVLLLRVLTSVRTFAYTYGYEMLELVAIFPYLGKFVYPFALVAETGTIYLTILVTLNRYISVCFPYKASDLCSIYYAKIHVAAIAAFSILFNLPRFFEYDIVTIQIPDVLAISSFAQDDQRNETLVKHVSTRVDLDPTALLLNRPYKIIYSNIFYFLVMFFIPLVSLVLLNQRLIAALRRTKRRRARMLSHSHIADSSSRSEDDITLMLIVVVIVFVVTQTPAMVTQVLVSSLEVSNLVCPSPFFFYERISDLLVVANSSLNFIIYCFCSRRFRQILLEIVCRRALTITIQAATNADDSVGARPQLSGVQPPSMLYPLSPTSTPKSSDNHVSSV